MIDTELPIVTTSPVPDAALPPWLARLVATILVDAVDEQEDAER